MNTSKCLINKVFFNSFDHEIDHKLARRNKCIYSIRAILSEWKGKNSSDSAQDFDHEIDHEIVEK